MSPLPLLHLSRLPFKRIHSFLNLKDIIELSLCSKRIKSRLSSMETLKKNPTMIVTIGRAKDLILEDGQRGVFKLSCLSDRDGRVVDLEELVKRKIDGKCWTICTTSKKLLCIESEPLESYLIFWIQYLGDIFNFTITKLSLYFNRNVNFDTVFKATNIIHKAKKIEFGACGMSHEEMTFLFDHLETEDLKLHVNPGKTFRYSKPIRFKKLDLIYTSWVTSENLLQIANYSEKIVLTDSPLVQAQFLNLLIKEWLESEDETLKYIKMNRIGERPRCVQGDSDFDFDLSPILDFEYPQFDKETLLEGLGAVNGTAKRSDASLYFDDRREYENGSDVTREDGKVATILCEESCGNVTFTFTVWDLKLPNLVE